MSITLNSDKQPQRITPKGQHLYAVTQYTEYGRTGQLRYPAVKAQGKLTLNSNPLNNETVTVGGKTYTFKTSLAGVDGEVKIGATKEATAQNLAFAINLGGTPNSQYSTQTTLHPTVSASADGVTAICTFTAKTGGVAGNSITLAETLSDGASTIDGATLGTLRAGVDESDSDSSMMPSYYGSVNVNTGQMWSIREAMYTGAGEIDGSDDRIWSNKDNAMAYPMHEYKLLAGATRKFFAPDHWGLNVKRFNSLNIKSYVQRPTWQQLVSPFAENTGNVAMHTVEMGDDRFAFFFRQQGGTTGIYVVIGQMQNDGTVTWGTPVLVTAKDQTDLNFDAILVNTDKILCAFGNGASDFMQTATLTVSGTSVSLNTPVQVAAVAYSFKRLAKLNTDKALLSYYTGTTLSIVVVTITGTVPSYGSIVTQATSANPVITANGIDKVQMVYQDTANSRLRSAVITVVGTTPTIQASILIGYDVNIGYKVNSHSLIQVATDKFIYYHPWGQLYPWRGRDRSKFIMLTVSGNTTSISHTFEVTNTVLDTNITYIKNYGTNLYAMYNFAQRRVGKIIVDLTNNKISVTDIPFRMNVWDDGTQQPVGVYKPAETDSIQRMADPAITTKGWAFCATDNSHLNGGIYMWTDKAFTFDVLLNDSLFGSFNKLIPSAIEPVQIQMPINQREVAMKIKNTGTVDLACFWIHKIIASLE